ncbi:Helix-turn-helix domain-containing protein [Pseudomonas cuatrocienegasensis]|uniref:Helix-turn-helix domain-containing protein n=2 Tax=Pseudomonas TaxID=286 RepID=A0ABY1BPT5_9PSED|nr:Helix-turn-helix domain-containing protein [Pseudomonas cuatrocienegasensis]
MDHKLSRIQNMDYSLITLRLGEQLRLRRLNRGLTQAALASLAGITRQKVIAIEKGDLSVGIIAYARVLAALDAELNVVPAAMPTLDEIHGVFD